MTSLFACAEYNSIHKDILHEKEDKKQLYKLVLEKFFQKPRRLNFRYR